MQQRMPPLSNQLRSAHDTGSRRWPDVRLTPEQFASHIERLQVDDPRLDSHGADLFLAAAACLQDPAALHHFDAEYLANARGAVARVDGAAHFIDEILQQLRVHLLIGASARLASYAAAGQLVDWVRVAAMRTAINAKRADHRVVPTDEVPLDKLLPDRDDELDAFKLRYADQFHRALEDSFQRLEPRERNLLRLHFLDGLSLDALATMHGVHRATIARWLVALRERLLEQARGRLGGGQELTSRSVRSLYRWLAKDVHLSVSRWLRQPPAP
jgi:RNA polymerase sigma-70 factor (ECF subfamily)